jgi:hypothetical protein
MSKLYIYDQTSLLDREQASGRFSAGENVYSLPVDSIEDLQGRLDYLVSSGHSIESYSRCTVALVEFSSESSPSMQQLC